MTETCRALPLAAILAAVLVAFGRATAQQAPEPLAVEPSGQFPVEDERRVVIEGITGELALQVGKPKELRFQSVRLGGKRQDLPVALYTAPGVVRITPPPDEPEGTPRLLFVSVPPEMMTMVRIDGTKITASGLGGGLEVQGKSLSVDLRGLECEIALTIDEGTVTAGTVAGHLQIHGTKLGVKAEGIVGGVSLTQNGGTAELRQIGAAVDADLDGVTLKADGIHGDLHVRARAGLLDVSGSEGGGDFQLTQTPLKLRKSKGDITVATDADVQFEELEASLHFDSYGGSLRGTNNRGLLEIRTRSAEVNVSQIAGPVRIQGDGLKITLSDVSGETLIYARTSEVTLESIGGPLTVENDGGPVSVLRATGEVNVKSSGGEVKILDVNGAVQLQADTDEVEVSWASITGTTNSSIRNERGSVTIQIPGQASGRIEAKSGYGRVESDLPRVSVLDEGNEAQGTVGSGSRPVISIWASGDITLRGPSGH